MPKSKEITRELNQVMLNAMLELKKLVDYDLSQKHDLNVVVYGAPVIQHDCKCAAFPENTANFTDNFVGRW